MAIVGFTIAFGGTGPISGDFEFAWLSNVTSLDGTIPGMAFVGFQMMFAVITPRRITGADRPGPGSTRTEEPHTMKLVTAVIKPFRIDEVKEALKASGASGITVEEVRWFGRQGGHTETYRGAEYQIDFVPKMRLSIVVEDDRVDDVSGRSRAWPRPATSATARSGSPTWNASCESAPATRATTPSDAHSGLG